MNSLSYPCAGAIPPSSSTEGSEDHQVHPFGLIRSLSSKEKDSVPRVDLRPISEKEELKARGEDANRLERELANARAATSAVENAHREKNDFMLS